MCKQCTKYKPSYNVNEIHPLKMELLNYLYMLIYIYGVSIIVCYLMTEPMKETSKSFGHRILFNTAFYALKTTMPLECLAVSDSWEKWGRRIPNIEPTIFKI